MDPLGRLGTEFCANFNLPDKSAHECIKGWLVAQACSRKLLATHGSAIVGSAINGAIAKNPRMKAAHSRDMADLEGTDAEMPRRALVWSDAAWGAVAQALVPAPHHDIRLFRTSENPMQQRRDCTHLSALDNQFHMQMSHLYGNMTGDVMLMYATHMAPLERRERIAVVCATRLGSTDVKKDVAQMLQIQNALVAEWKPDEVARQYAIVMAGATVAAGAATVIAAPAAITAGAATAAPAAAPTAPRAVGRVALNDNGLLDDQCDVVVKAFSHSISLDPTHTRDYQRFVYMMAGLRNAPELINTLLSDQTQTVTEALHTRLLSVSAEPVHDETYFPNVLVEVVKDQRSATPLQKQRRLLMSEVNQFISALYGADQCQAEKLHAVHVAQWLTAHSVGNAHDRLSGWFGSALSPEQEATLSDYLKTNAGPSPQAMRALQQLYLPASF